MNKKIYIYIFFHSSVTESGFGADIGMEKFFNIKCRYSGEFFNYKHVFTFQGMYGECAPF